MQFHHYHFFIITVKSRQKSFWILTGGHTEAAKTRQIFSWSGLHMESAGRELTVLP